MNNSEAKRIESRLDAYTTAHRCSWAEAMKMTGLPDPESLNTNVSTNLESDSVKTMDHFDSSDIAINGIIKAEKYKRSAER